MGAGMLLGCGELWLQRRAGAERAAVGRVRALGELFVRMAEQIEGFCLPLVDILQGLSDEERAACGLTVGSPTEVLVAAADTLPPSAAAIVRRAASALGRGGRQDQVYLCRGTARELEDCHRLLTEKAETDIRARRTLWRTASLCVIILLW